MSKLEAAPRLVLAFHKAFNLHDVEGMMALMSDDCLFENTTPAPDGAEYTGKEAVEKFWRGFFEASPKAGIKTEDIFGMGDRCVARWRYSWEDASGGQGHVRGVDIVRVKNGFIQEIRSYVKG